jgi:outer membrane lipoprotein LolB
MRLALLAGTLALTACASLVPAPPEASWSGRFSATARLPERTESMNGSFRLEERPGSTILDLNSPLGTTLLRVEQDRAGARATGPNGLSVGGADAEALSEELLGVRLPVSGLPHWIDGRPVPGRVLARSGGEAGGFQQDGWAVSVLERDAAGHARRVLLERPALAPAPALRVLLVVDERSGRAGTPRP